MNSGYKTKNVRVTLKCSTSRIPRTITTHIKLKAGESLQSKLYQEYGTNLLKWEET